MVSKEVVTGSGEVMQAVGVGGRGGGGYRKGERKKRENGW